MAGEIQIGGTTFATESGGTVTLSNVGSATNRTNLGLGSIATQAADSVSISGGNITGGTIGSGVVFPTFVGMIASFAMSSAPTGWLVCNGAEYAIADYGDLHTAIGTTWGALTNGSGGAGSTHFRVPDLRGAFLRGTGSHASSTMANGSAFSGPSVGSFENDQAQGHYHQIRGYNNVSGDLSGTSANGSMRIGVGTTSDSSQNIQEMKTDGTNGTPRSGDETRPFNAGINYCIKY